MAYFPVNARSELVKSANSAGGGVVETFRKFQIASCASIFPARSPTLGSGFGALVDISGLGEGEPFSEEEVE